MFGIQGNKKMGDIRSLTIKTGTLRRLSKELEMYRKEEESESQKVKTLREKQADPHDIKYAVWTTFDLRGSVDLSPLRINNSSFFVGKYFE